MNLNFLKSSLFFLALANPIANQALALSNDEAQSLLRDYAKDPEKFSKSRPEKVDSSGNVVHDNPMELTAEELNSGSWLKKKLDSQEKIWKTILKTIPTNGVRGSALSPLSEINLETDNPENVVDAGQMKYRKLSDMEWFLGNVKSTRLQVQPWSDTYWPIYLGLSANRYGDPSFPWSRDWTTNRNYVLGSLGQASNMAYLSPAEKYDLLVGDKNFTLTKASLGVAEYLNARWGKVEGWQGICHGWSGASIMLDRPIRGVNMLSTEGQSIPFYPSDIKALSSLLWANGIPTANMLGAGKRCFEANPDIASRATHPECWDNNPATIHLALVNQLSAAKRSLVMDVTWDSEVWNQPIIGYSFTYFNPQNLLTTDDIISSEYTSWSSAQVKVADFSNDRYKENRSSRVASIVGVVMEVTYLVENSPQIALTDSPAQDGVRKVRYVYDLELDAQDNLIGGEWYQKDHPDFLWVPKKDSKALSEGDPLVGILGITAAAQKSSAHVFKDDLGKDQPQPQPLSIIVDQLIRYSTKR